MSKSFGTIFGSATQTFAVLSEASAKPLQQIHNAGHIDPDQFSVIDNDDWLSRIWTLFEMVKSKKVFFIARSDGSVLHLALDLLGVILTDTCDYADAQGFERAELAIRFPWLEKLQNTIAMDRIGEHVGQSAYQVMSEFQQRDSALEESRIYAMIAAISDFPTDEVGDSSQQLVEHFMHICEEKGDYSFIYCTAPRSDIPGRGWHPVSDRLQPVIPGILASGSGLSGCLNATHLKLDNMCRMTPSRLNSVAKSIGNFLHDNIATAILERLRQKGFTGCGEYLELENGYFFPQSSFTRSKDMFVVASPDVQWVQGAPALLLRSNDTDINQFCDVGVFIGRLPQVGESINVG